MKKGKKSGGWTGIAAPRLQHSWKSVFVVVVFLVLATTTLMIDQVFQGETRPFHGCVSIHLQALDCGLGLGLFVEDDPR